MNVNGMVLLPQKADCISDDALSGKNNAKQLGGTDGRDVDK